MLFSPFMGYPAYDLDLDFPIGHYVCQLCHILAAKVRHFGDKKIPTSDTKKCAFQCPTKTGYIHRMTEWILFLRNT